MKITHIPKQINETECLTHFLHTGDSCINVLEIVYIKFDQNTVSIRTTDGFCHLISDLQIVEEIKKYFQVTYAISLW